MGSPRVSLLFIFTFILILVPSHSFPFSTPYQTIFSLAHTLCIRVANLRSARGDLAGSARARYFAHKITLVKFLWSIGYMRNYSWRDSPSAFYDALGLVSDLNELMKAVNELTRFDSDGDRSTAWLQRKHSSNIIRVTKSLFGRLSKVFYQQGPLREVVQMLQKEVVEGELLRDCLELGSGDLKGLIQIVEDIAGSGDLKGLIQIVEDIVLQSSSATYSSLI